jgi:hypothetical protein
LPLTTVGAGSRQHLLDSRTFQTVVPDRSRSHSHRRGGAGTETRSQLVPLGNLGDGNRVAASSSWQPQAAEFLRPPVPSNRAFQVLLPNVAIDPGAFPRGSASQGAHADSVNFFRAQCNVDPFGPVLWCSHRCGSNITATLFPNCSHTGRIGRLRFALSIYYRRWDLNPHPLARTGF